jgi:SNF2 family DNA or RNA helicase
LAWLDERQRRRPVLPAERFRDLLPGLRQVPYPFQWTGAEFLARAGRGLLADEMGLGKTVQAILAAAALRRATPPVRAVTMTCPASLRGGWQDEICKWLGEQAMLLEGNTAQRADKIRARPAWLITRYEQVLRDHVLHRDHAPDLLIVDEAERAKGLATRTARVLKAIGARHIFALTGTALENRLEDAYAITQLIDQRLLPPLWQLDHDHFERAPKGGRVLFYRGLDAIRSRLAPAFLRRTKEEVDVQLPARVRSTRLVPLHPAVVDTYEDVMAGVARIAAKRMILPADLERMQKLLVIARRCCDGPQMLNQVVPYEEVPKLVELTHALRELCLGERRKLVVFSEWTDMTDCVERLAAGLALPAFHLKGEVPVRRRPQLVRGFSQHPGAAVFVSTDAGGVGLNLQAADAIINLDLPWNPARLEQRIARVHRIGSTRMVQVLLLITRDSIEERILSLHDTKRAVLTNVRAKHGEDRIRAPGGSGAFCDMVRQLISTPAPAPATAVEPASPAPIPVDPEPPARVDLGALTTAAAALIPSLPADHRRSLAVVFRALAEALSK